MSERTRVRTTAAGEFKAKRLRVMEDVRKFRTPVVITKKGRPIAKLVPPDEGNRPGVFGCMSDKIKIVGDIESPVLPPVDRWDVATRHDGAARPKPRGRRRRQTGPRRIE